jgi:superoxide dismutase, Fe-Mn family
MRFELPDLPYELDALEPYISKKTLEFHRGKYHQTCLSNLNNLIQKTKYKSLDLETIIKVSDGPVFNYASQVWNHTFYFECLQPGDNNPVKGPFAEVIKRNFGTFSFFKNTFARAAESLFGAGWVWLVLNPSGSMEIIQKSNAGNPLRIGLNPLLTCDVWEHAYYLDYQNSRQDYLKAFWKLISWEIIEKRYSEFFKTPI